MQAANLRLLVFDLDGTLVDSQHDLANSVNATLKHLHWQTLPNEQIAGFIGDGASMLVRRALTQASGTPPDEELAAEALEYFLRYYREHMLDFTYVYEGVLTALQSLKEFAPERKMAVLTNKPFRPARKICDALGLSPYFFQNYGGDSFVTKKPEPEGLLKLIQEASVEPSECVLIGDSHVDVETARNAGTWSLGCTYGLAPQSLRLAAPDVLVDSPAEWPRWLNQTSSQQ